jgi:tripartite-type tricarboxylate transporter receptor subunit TctC
MTLIFQRIVFLACNVAVAVAATATAAIITNATAQDYPSSPITIVVGFPPGGPTDTVARIIANQMSKSLGQSVIVENVPGAAGTIGGARVARAKPDGYTLSVGQWSSNVGAGAIYPLPYHVMNDFEPVALLTTSYLWIVGRKNLPANNLKELVAWLKENPGKATAGSIGVGSAAQMCIIDFQNKTGTKFLIVQYKGGAPAGQDLLGGRIDFICQEASQTLPYVQSGQLKVFGVAANKRWFVAPEVPTIGEAGVPEVDIAFWHGLWAPKGTQKNIIARLNTAVVDAFADPSVQKLFAGLGHEIPSRDQLTPETLAAFHKAELEKWWPIMRAAGLKAN